MTRALCHSAEFCVPGNAEIYQKKEPDSGGLYFPFKLIATDTVRAIQQIPQPQKPP